jgi:hypothetical protein
MAVCHPTSRSLHEPMADPAERPSPDAATESSTDLDLVEYLVVAVSDLGSLGTVTAALADLVASEAIRILDLVCVSKAGEGGEGGELTVVEYEEVEELAALQNVEGDIGGLLSVQDIDTASRRLTPGSSAILLLVEDRWAGGLSAAARQAGGRLVGGGRVARPLLEAAWRLGGMQSDVPTDSRGREAGRG